MAHRDDAGRGRYLADGFAQRRGAVLRVLAGRDGAGKLENQVGRQSRAVLGHYGWRGFGLEISNQENLLSVGRLKQQIRSLAHEFREHQVETGRRHDGATAASFDELRW